MAQADSRWARRLARAGVALAALAIALAAAGKWWLAPAIIRWQIQQQVPDYWDGAAEVGGVDFSYTGPVPVTLRGLALRDRRGREWFRADELRLGVPNWPSLRPRLTSAVLAAPRLTLHVSGGRCDLPLRRIPSQWWREHVDLQSLLVKNGCAEFRADGNSLARSGPADVLLCRRNGAFALEMPGRPPVLTGLAVDASVADDGVDVRHMTFEAAGGRISGRLNVQLRPGGPAARGALVARALDLARLKLPVRGAQRGLAAAVAEFRLDGLDLRALAGHGSAIVEGADLRNVPAAIALMRGAGLGSPDDLRDADVGFSFSLRDALATFQEGRVQLPLAAVDLEPGATLDLRTGQMDAVAVVLVFDKVRHLLKAVSVVGLMVDLTQQSSRYRLRGRWHDLDSVVVSPAPPAELRDGSKRYLTAAARGGRRLGRSILGSLTDLFNGIGGADPKGAGGATRPARP